MPEQHLFVWRGQKLVLSSRNPTTALPSPYRNAGGEGCPFCRGEYDIDAKIEPVYRCKQCGFWFHSTSSGGGGNAKVSHTYVSILKELSIADDELALEELGSHLRRRFSDVYDLSPYRFEKLVADIYGRLGFECRVTKKSRDGGVDIYLIERATGEQLIVECKRYSADRSIHVGLVRQLLGVQLCHGVPRAIMVTTGRYTQPSQGTVQALADNRSGYSLELVDAARLLEMLDVYNKKLPPLEIDARFRAPA
ncbi:MAG: restriction endonuclease [Thermoanaerobaculia bacterium]